MAWVVASQGRVEAVVVVAVDHAGMELHADTAQPAGLITPTTTTTARAGAHLTTHEDTRKGFRLVVAVVVVAEEVAVVVVVVDLAGTEQRANTAQPAGLITPVTIKSVQCTKKMQLVMQLRTICIFSEMVLVVAMVVVAEGVAVVVDYAGMELSAETARPAGLITLVTIKSTTAMLMIPVLQTLPCSTLPKVHLINRE